MQLIDSLDAGGAERVAVNIANLLPRDRYTSHLCATRRGGILAAELEPDVGQLVLGRRGRFDGAALRQLAAYIGHHRVRILHAHSTSLLTAVLASMWPPFPKVIWHDHFGRYATEVRPAWPYWLLARRVSCVISVNYPLADWSRRNLALPAERVIYLPNFAWVKGDAATPPPSLPGEAGYRVVCVANLRPQKDHLTLIRALAMVVQEIPTAHLLVVGTSDDIIYQQQIHREIAEAGLERQVSLLGQRQDVPAILAGCDVGVLSSVSEGLPLALIEYGLAGLPAVATAVGQCPDVLDQGRVGRLVPPQSPERLAEALLELLRAPERRLILGQQFRQWIETHYSPQAIIARIGQIYETTI
jgi:glycosyltransferase involved in cell wall biosynthesis